MGTDVPFHLERAPSGRDSARTPDPPRRSPREANGRDLQSATLECLRSSVRYRRWICALAEHWLGDAPLEIGSGLGDSADEWRKEGRILTVSEADPDRLRSLRERFGAAEDVQVRRVVLPSRANPMYTSVVAINVLEHIEDDVAAVRTMAEFLVPGGHAVLFVPAFPAAFSRFDREIGHHRRYTRRGVTDVLERAGMHPVACRYVNPLGLIGWMLLMKLLRSTPRDGLLLSTFDRFIVPLQRSLERWIAPPFGQSVLVIGRRP